MLELTVLAGTTSCEDKVQVGPRIEWQRCNEWNDFHSQELSRVRKLEDCWTGHVGE